MTENCHSQARARLSRATVAVFAALAVLSTAGMNVDARHAATSFVATDLGTLGMPHDGSVSEAFGVNDKGVVVGNSSKNSNAKAFHAFVWSEQMGMTDLGALEGNAQTEATVITNDGVIAGFGRDSDIGPAHAFVRTHANGLVDLSTLGGPATTLTAINGKGDVVGSSDLADGTFHAFLRTRQDGTIRDLGTLGTQAGQTSIANAISDEGLVVGESATDPDNVSHAFLWTRRSGKMVDLGTLDGGLTSAAQAVSDGGVVVGNSQVTDTSGLQINHAFVWTHRTRMVDIGDSGDAAGGGVSSFAEKINGRFVIGHFTKNGATHGFVWTQKRGFVDIGTLDGDTTSLVTGVNARGVVVGNSFVTGGASRAFVWTTSSGITPLPTPVGGSSRVNAITDDFIVGAACGPDGICHATLWKPPSHAHDGRGRDEDDE
jgi:probable HAF family extracellular repeat protein